MDIQKFRPQKATPISATGPVTKPKPALSAQSPTPVTQPKPSPAAKPQEKPKVMSSGGKKLSSRAISRDSKEYFVENLSMLFATGVTVGDALASVAQEAPSPKVKKVIEVMITKIDEGAPFWKALDETGLLGGSAVALIRIGEESGRLPENLKVVSEQMHKSNMMAAKVKSAMLYPAFLIVLLFLVGGGISIYLLPKLADIFKGLDVQLSLMTKVLLSSGQFLGHYGLYLFGSIALVVGLLIFGMLNNSVMRVWGENILYVIPGIKKLLYESELGRFGFILGSLLEAGLPVVDALNSLAGSMATRRYQHLALYLKASIEEGNSFSKALTGYTNRKVLPGPVRQLIVSAEKSGNLSPTLIKAGSIYEDKADITARSLETLLEPIILVLIAVAVLFIALAVVVPIYSLIGGLNDAK